jgi:cbb3-type cytochrome oxidase cytochrome c subunit
MAGIVSATVTQIEEAHRALVAAAPALQLFNQGTFRPTKITPAQVTEIDALLATLKAKLALLTT